jgi:hypothetical protein
LFLAASALGVVSLLGFGASALLARQGILSTNDGRVLQGDIAESADGQSVNITVHGATVTLDKSNVSTISYSDDAPADFQKRLKALNPDDVKGRLDLAQFELTAKQYDLATEAAKDVQRIDPHNPDAAVLLDTIKSEQNLKTTTAVEAATSQPTEQGNATTNASAKYLTLTDVYIIRAAEAQPDDNVQAKFYNEVRQRFTSLHKEVAGFDSMSQAQQALQILQSGDANLMKDVRVENDPKGLAEFHQRVLPRVLTGCLSCHGATNGAGGGAGGFVLYPDSRDPTVWYTDFYILQKGVFKVHSTDMFGSGLVTRRMIDRLRPENSLLLNFGLPQLVSTAPHPDAKGFTPIFHSLGDPAYLGVAKWIDDLTAIAPEYGIKYDIPTGPNGPGPNSVGATTQP